ncbi:MAG: dihydroneopterin aldolase [Erythrobacter sp.]|uniref:dihydroneopterin aldolase n=1 Tax=Erythrobacter sp. TaxID=1042 RepID=UPI0032EF1E56
MTRATIDLKGLELPVALGTYGPGDVVPDAHLLDGVLEIDPELLLVDEDRIDRVFDYDPLIERILAVAGERHYETQEYLLSRIASLCAGIEAITAIDLSIYKTPVTSAGGRLGVRLVIPREEFGARRAELSSRFAR